jgi:putative ABC transport system substrate-binding protein
VKRREFIALLGGAAAAWPLTANAQPSPPVVGVLGGFSFAGGAITLAAFRQGLSNAPSAAAFGVQKIAAP